MCPVVKAKFQIEGTIQHAYSLIYWTINTMVGPLSITREIPPAPPDGAMPRRPSFVALEYTPGGYGRLARQIVLTFQEKENNTIVSLEWFYPTLELGMITGQIPEAIERRITELKIRIGAKDLEESLVKEVIKEKEVIVKVRCPYCANLYDASLDKCPHCGGHH